MRQFLMALGLLTATTAQAQVTPVAPFTGDYTEGFDAQPGGFVACFDVGNPIAGDVCATSMHATTGWGFTCTLNPYSGSHFAGSTGTMATYTFSVPVHGFGGYFSTNAGTGFDATFRFYDAAGALLHSTTEPIQNCAWDWFGWDSATAIATIEVEGSTGGGFVMMDEIQIVEVPIPDADGDGWLIEDGDCNDGDANTYPYAPEICDGRDNDCDGTLPFDEQDADGDGVIACEDCDDGNNAAYPGNPERCDGIDNDCDGVIDPGELDSDGDGMALCEGDCDDDDADRTPGAPEICDGKDNDCDGNLPADELDIDGDGFALCDGDCDDSSQDLSPGNAEIPGDGIDNDCLDGDAAVGAGTGTGTGTTPLDTKPGGCGCTSTGGTVGWVALLPALALLRRRRS